MTHRPSANRLIRGAVGENALRVELALKVRCHGGEHGGGFHQAEIFISGKDFLHLREIFHMVGAEINHAVGRKHAAGERGEARLDEAVFLLFSFRPWVGKIKMQRGDGRGR